VVTAISFRRYEPADHERVVELHRLGLRQTGTDLGAGPWDDDMRSADTIRASYLDGRGDFLVGVLDGTCASTLTINGAVSARRCSSGWNGYRQVGSGTRGRFDLVIFEKDLS
jgi:hypothetical protein